FQAVEDHGRRFHPVLAQTVAQALALELAALDAAGAEGRTLPALARRAVAHRLRHELEQAGAALTAARALVGGEWPEWLAYVGVSTTLADEYLQQLKKVGRRSVLPELPALLPLFWAPPADVTDQDAWFSERVRAATTGQEQYTWLQRWVAARPESAQARQLRADVVSRSGLRDRLFWQALEDLEALVALAPEQGQPRFDLGTNLVLQLDYAGVGEHLRLLARRGARPQVEKLLEQLAGSFLKQDPDWPAFRTAVVGADAEWRAFVQGLVRPHAPRGGDSDR
ncbi:MAG: hypothetical protein IT345_13760, partial [Trueperaceae bacterium]|nr:hypothetical protein [Trueperaceae bacterium]